MLVLIRDHDSRTIAADSSEFQAQSLWRLLSGISVIHTL